jgi:hypothetical protein
MFRHFSNIIVTFLVSESRKAKGGLTSTTMLLWEVDSEFVDHFTCITGKSSEEGAISIHDNETEAGIGLEQFGERFSVELVVTKVERSTMRRILVR